LDAVQSHISPLGIWGNSQTRKDHGSNLLHALHPQGRWVKAEVTDVACVDQCMLERAMAPSL